MKQLTDRGIRALKPRPHKSRPAEFIPYRVADPQTQGLHIQVKKCGQYNWTLRYRFNGQQRFLKLGSYPATSIAEARQRALEAQGKVEAGLDPAAEHRHLPATPTVARLLEAYLDDRAEDGVKSVNYMRSAFDKNVIPYLGGLPTSAVSTAIPITRSASRRT